MKKTMKYVLGLALTVFLVSCGSGGGGGSSSGGTSPVTIAIGNTGAAGAGVVSSQGYTTAIPSDVETIEVIILSGNTQLVDETYNVSGQSGFTETYDLPNGENIFQVIARNSHGSTRYFGDTTENVTGPMLVRVLMEPFLCYTYSIKEVPFQWDGTPDPQISETGDDEHHVYTLPWTFAFYGKAFPEITQDSNGNIWFEHPNDNYEIDLPSGDGFGRVISAWNDDLDSDDYGDGFEIQYKTDPERVVLSWDTETHEDRNSDYLNRFEVVLFPDGRIRIDYKYFDCSYCYDNGSGISRGDEVHYINLTEMYDYVYNLEGRSFLFTCDIKPSSSNPLVLKPASTEIIGYTDDSVTFTASGGVPPYTWSNAGSGGRLTVINDTQAEWSEDYDYCGMDGPETATVTVTDSEGNSFTSTINIPYDEC